MADHYEAAENFLWFTAGDPVADPEQSWIEKGHVKLVSRAAPVVAPVSPPVVEKAPVHRKK